MVGCERDMFISLHLRKLTRFAPLPAASGRRFGSAKQLSSSKLVSLSGEPVGANLLCGIGARRARPRKLNASLGRVIFGVD